VAGYDVFVKYVASAKR